MKFRKHLSLFLISVMILSSCSSVGNGDTDLTVTEEVTDIPADSTTIISEVDPMSDADLETTDESSGAFFDSFTSSDGGNKWTAEKTSSVNYSDGAMTISTDYYDNDSSVNRNLFKALEDNFKVEFRLKVSSEGRRVGFVCGMGGRRIFAYIFPDAMLIQTTNGALDEIVLPIYNEWHTYCFIAENGVVHFYFDGGYVVSFNPQISPSSKITFFAACVTSHATVYSVDYISYTPFSSEPVALLDISDGVLSDVNSFTLTARVGADVRDEGEEVSYYANGVRIGSSAKKGVAYSYDWEDIPQGTYIIHAEYGKYKSAPVTVTFGEQEQSEIKVREAEYEVSTQTKLTSSYALSFTKSGGSATLSACDGLYLLDLKWVGGELLYVGADGEGKTVGGQDYCILVDSGFCTVYSDGNFAASFLMPVSKEYMLPESEGISDLTVGEYGKMYYAFDATVEEVRTGLDDFGDCYALTFVTDSVSDGALKLFDGACRTRIMIRGGKIYADDCPKLTSYERCLGDVPAGLHVWRLTVEGGIGRLYLDNSWFASVRLPVSSAGRYAYVSGDIKASITSLDERYYASVVKDEDWNDYFTFSGTDYSVSGGAFSVTGKVTAVNNLFAKNVSYGVDLKITDKSKGYFYILLGYTNEYKGLYAGVNFEKFRFEIISLGSKGQTLLSSAKADIGSGLTLTAEKSGNTVTLYSGGNEVVSAVYGDLTPGRTGFAADGSVTVGKIKYIGDGYAQKTLYAQNTGGNVSPQIIELNGTLYMCVGGKNNWMSSDGGTTWQTVSGINTSGLSNNMVLTESGRLVTICQVGSNRLIQDIARVSDDGGMTWKEYPLQGKPEYRITMNCKLIRTESGRLFYTSGATGHAVEHSSVVDVYYSDNGTIWKKSQTNIGYKTTNMNLQENVIVDLGNGILRMFARSDRGFLYYSDSKDNGVTWETEFRPSVFASVESAFNVVRDFETGYLWMAWEYSCENDNGTVQYPRTRVALALSRDSGETWEFVSDIDESFLVEANHFNIGIGVTSDYVFVTVVKSTPTASANELKNYVTRLDKNVAAERTLKRMPGLVRSAAPERQTDWYSDCLTRSVILSDGLAVIGGDDYTDIEYSGTDSYVPVSRFADVAGMRCSESGGRAVLSLGSAKYTFENDSDVCTLKNGDTVKLGSKVKKTDGELCVRLSDMANILGWKTVSDERYTAVYYTAFPVDFDFIVRNTHI